MEQRKTEETSRISKVLGWIGIAFILGVLIQILRAANGNHDAQALLLGAGGGALMGVTVAGITIGLLALPRVFGHAYKPGILAFVLLGSLVMAVMKLLVPSVVEAAIAETGVARPIQAQESHSGQWTWEQTAESIVDPYAQVPAGTRYYRVEGGLVKLYPPGVRPDLPAAYGLTDYGQEWPRAAVSQADASESPTEAGSRTAPPPPSGFVVDQQQSEREVPSLDDILAGRTQTPTTACVAGFHSIGSECWKDCPEGYHAIAANSDKCEENIEPYVDRNFFGGCPTGYVAHPMNPKKCALPALAARYYQRH